MNESKRSLVNDVLTALMLLDLTFAVLVFTYPQSWAEMFYGTILIDPHGFLPRMGANWLAFAVIQGIALVKWRKQPHWLLIVAGARFGDVLTDWTNLAFASSRTWTAWMALGLASPGNLIAGMFLVKAYFSRSKASAR